MPLPLAMVELEPLAAFLVAALILLVLLLLWRLCCPREKRCSWRTLRTLLVLGSGGHTAEMLRLAAAIDRNKFTPRTYVCAKTDALSSEKVVSEDEGATVMTVPRVREVGQSWASTLLSATLASISSYFVLWRTKPDLVLCNGPGTCVPFCVGAWINNLFGLSRTKIVFVESVCRVRTLSLSGWIVSWIADETLVQWPELAESNSRVKFVARFT